jgi:rRNA maturation endonuclease Nob1
MTEGQWIWIMVHMAVDDEEKMEKTCKKCKTHMDDNRCIHCGTQLVNEETLNPNFNEEMFEKLKKTYM